MNELDSINEMLTRARELVRKIPLESHAVALPGPFWRIIEKAGDGNRSLGIALLIARAMADNDDEPQTEESGSG